MLLAMGSETLAGGGDGHSVRKDAAVMTKNRIPRDPTKDGAFRQIDSIAVDLPPPETKFWVARRKAAIVNAVLSGAVSLEEVCRRYELSVEEFITWQRAIEAHGVAGSRVTRLQVYRHAPPARLAQRRLRRSSILERSIRYRQT
jgi:transposase-like protein